MRITRVESRAIADSRRRPTLETTLVSGELSEHASAPSGKSTGSHEALELRDASGGVSSAIANVAGVIADAISGRDFSSADEIDDVLIALDGTSNKANLGANAVLSVSIAAQRLFARFEGVPLWAAIASRGNFRAKAPALYVNVINGGAHADFKLPFQEYLLVVSGDLKDAYARAQRAYAAVGAKLSGAPLGDEGGYAPTFAAVDEPFNILEEAIAGSSGMRIALDAAATELRHDGRYRLDKSYSADELLAVYDSLSSRYRLQSIEDPFAEDEAENFARLTARVGNEVLVIGDDLTVTDPSRIDAAAKARAINAVLIKPNQIGSVKEAIQAVQKTYAHGWQAICSHRSGETMDTFIADFAYGVGAFGIKAGGFAQRQRVVKYERLIEIQEEAINR